jgi:hypothetical protein
MLSLLAMKYLMPVAAINLLGTSKGNLVRVGTIADMPLKSQVSKAFFEALYNCIANLYLSEGMTINPSPC